MKIFNAKTIVSCALTALVCFGAGYAARSQADPGITEKEFDKRYHELLQGEDSYETRKALAEAYMQGPTNRDVVRRAIHLTISGETQSGIAMQVAQNQTIIEQNDRIIQLLEKISKK